MTAESIFEGDFLEDIEVTIKKGRIEVKRSLTEDIIILKHMEATVDKDNQPMDSKS